MTFMKNFDMLREKVKHGRDSFPLCVYDNVGYSHEFLGYHWHSEAEFIYIAEGDAIFSVDSEPVPLHAGEALCINSGAVHSGHLSHTSFCKYYAVVFDWDILSNNRIGESENRYIRPLAQSTLKVPLKFTEDSHPGHLVISKIRSIITCFLKSGPGYELEILCALYSIVLELIHEGSLIAADSDAGDYKTVRFKKQLDFIHQHYNQKIGIRDMAEYAGMSEYYFCRFFKAMCGRTPFGYLNFYRVNQAARDLAQTDHKILDIALESGFSNFSYFIKTFKAIIGCTPSAYRSRFRR